jgi:hypothetical protein
MLKRGTPVSKSQSAMSLLSTTARRERTFKLLATASVFVVMSRFVPEQFAAFTKDGQPIDAAFRAAAKVPAEWMEVGVVRQGPPFDMNEFTRLCAEESGGSEHT